MNKWFDKWRVIKVGSSRITYELHLRQANVNVHWLRALDRVEGPTPPPFNSKLSGAAPSNSLTFGRFKSHFIKFGYDNLEDDMMCPWFINW